MRGETNTFLEMWAKHTVVTSAGELAYTVFPGPESFIGCTRLNGVPISPLDARPLLDELGHEHARMRFLGDDRPAVQPLSGYA